MLNKVVKGKLYTLLGSLKYELIFAEDPADVANVFATFVKCPSYHRPPRM